HVVPFFAGHLACLATDAERGIGEESHLRAFLHVVMPALIRAVNSLPDHVSSYSHACWFPGKTAPPELRPPSRLIIIAPLPHYSITALVLIVFPLLHVAGGQLSTLLPARRRLLGVQIRRLPGRDEFF